VVQKRTLPFVPNKIEKNHKMRPTLLMRTSLSFFDTFLFIDEKIIKLMLHFTSNKNALMALTITLDGNG
jgi:hypothetical protein